MRSPYGLPVDCLACYLRSDDFFCALSPGSLEAFNQIKHPSVFPKGAVIFVEGQKPRGIFMICQGQAKLSTISHDGEVLVIRIAKAGDVLGLDAVVTGKPHEVTAETIQPSRMNFVNREDFLAFLRKHSDASLHAAQHISRDCQQAYEATRSIGVSRSISARIAEFLLTSAAAGRVTNGVVRARLKLTPEDIARLMGTSRETIAQILSELSKKDIVELKGSTLIIHNKPALEQLVAA
jgi:CRP/FNR family transcriptional regulator, cyclic AMP receptor protein